MRGHAARSYAQCSAGLRSNSEALQAPGRTVGAGNTVCLCLSRDVFAYHKKDTHYQSIVHDKADYCTTVYAEPSKK